MAGNFSPQEFLMALEKDVQFKDFFYKAFPSQVVEYEAKLEEKKRKNCGSCMFNWLHKLIKAMDLGELPDNEKVVDGDSELLRQLEQARTRLATAQSQVPAVVPQKLSESELKKLSDSNSLSSKLGMAPGSKPGMPGGPNGMPGMPGKRTAKKFTSLDDAIAYINGLSFAPFPISFNTTTENGTTVYLVIG